MFESHSLGQRLTRKVGIDCKVAVATKRPSSASANSKRNGMPIPADRPVVAQELGAADPAL